MQLLGRLLSVGVVFAVAGAAFAAPNTAPVTFNKEVLPILQKRCQDCHRPGETAPFSMLNYKDARPWAKSIKAAVLSKKMPPWFADPSVGHFLNDRSLSQSEIDLIVAWVDGGVLEGNAKDAPAPREFVQGWEMGKPDMIVKMPKAFDVPATGQVEYQYVIIPTGLTEDKWVVAAEVRPGNRAVMHHVITSIRESGSTWMADKQPGDVFVPPKGPARGGQLNGGLVGYVPGQVIRPASEGPHRATLLKAGSDIVFQLHYTPNGKATTDQTEIGLIFAKEPPKEKLMGGNSALMRLTLPPNEDNIKLTAVSTVPVDCELVSMMPHAHLRGKSFEYSITRPDGTTEKVLSVPKYDFNWQLTYWLAEPIHMPKGTKVELTAVYDNSANNKYNPDPNKEVHWGEQTTEEMMMGYFSYVVDPGQDTPPSRRGTATGASGGQGQPK